MIESLGPYPYKSFEFNATKGQTTFNGNDRFGKRLEYELNKTTVYLNGIKLKESTDWTAVEESSTVVLQEPVANNDVVSLLTHMDLNQLFYLHKTKFIMQIQQF